VAVRILATLVPLHSVVHIVGGNGLVDEAEKAGFSVTHVSGDRPAAVLQGFSPTVAWTDLAEAAFSLHTGIPWIATNMDWTIPVPGGVAPGNGTLVSAVHTAVGRLPIIAGKPEVAIFEEARQRFHSASPLFVGDRLDTDILGANRAGMTAALVLTGIDGPKQLLAADKTMRPTYIVRDLRELHSPYPVTRFTKDKTIATVGRSTVRLQGNTVEIDNEGDSEVDLLRAACAVIWNSGRAIYGLSVPERLYASSVTPK
jgi:glycerol 3-phosphatase-2